MKLLNFVVSFHPTISRTHDISGTYTTYVQRMDQRLYLVSYRLEIVSPSSVASGSNMMTGRSIDGEWSIVTVVFTTNPREISEE